MHAATQPTNLLTQTNSMTPRNTSTTPPMAPPMTTDRSAATPSPSSLTSARSSVSVKAVATIPQC